MRRIVWRDSAGVIVIAEPVGKQQIRHHAPAASSRRVLRCDGHEIVWRKSASALGHSHHENPRAMLMLFAENRHMLKWPYA